MPNRILKDSTLTSPNLNRCSIPAQDLFKRILVLIDDYGCADGNCEIIYGRAYSMCMDKVKVDDVTEWRQELIDNGLISVWEENKREYILFNSTEKHLCLKSYTDDGKPTRHRRKTPEPPKSLMGSQDEPERAKESQNEPNPNPNPKPKHNHNNILLSEYLYKEIQKNNPGHKKPNFKKWVIHIDRMIRIDKRDPEKIKEVIKWCQADSFWYKNILSTQKLREKFDQLVVNMNGKKPETVNWDKALEE
jgi:hypothetical protein